MHDNRLQLDCEVEQRRPISAINRKPLQFALSAGFTRPANTTQYAAKDIVSDNSNLPLVFKFADPIMQSGFFILTPFLISSNPAAISGSFKLLLFRSPPTVGNDNAVFAPTIGELSSLLAVVTLDTPIKVSTGTIYVPSGFVPIWCMSLIDDRGFYGVLLDDATYTPASRETFRIVLNGQWE